MQELHIHERISRVLTILDRMTLTGFQQFNAVSTAMRELAALDQDIAKAEAKQAKQEEPSEDGECEACQIRFENEGEQK